MTQVNKNEKYFRDLVNDLNQCLTDANLEGAFQRVKDYIFKNFSRPDAERKSQEVITYQAAFSRVSKHKRIGDIGYAEYNQEVSKITLNIQEFVQTLKPDGIEIETSSLFPAEVERDVWNYYDNLVSSLIFLDGFSLLDSIFNEFKVSCRNKMIVRVDRYFFDGTRKIMIDEGAISSLHESELQEVITEHMDWFDAVILQKKDINGFLLAEGLVLKSQKDEEVIIRTNGSNLHARSELMREVIDWFKKTSYPESIQSPFYVKVHYSGLDVFQYFGNL